MVKAQTTGKDITQIGGEDKLPTELVDYKYLVTQQIFKCQIMLTEANVYQDLEKTKKAIDVFEAMLTSCHLDQTFKDDMQKLEAAHKEMVDKLTPLQKRVEASHILHSYILTKWKNLLSLASRAGFTYIERRIVRV